MKKTAVLLLLSLLAVFVQAEDNTGGDALRIINFKFTPAFGPFEDRIYPVNETNKKQNGFFSFYYLFNMMPNPYLMETKDDISYLPYMVKNKTKGLTIPEFDKLDLINLRLSHKYFMISSVSSIISGVIGSSLMISALGIYCGSYNAYRSERLNLFDHVKYSNIATYLAIAGGSVDLVLTIPLIVSSIINYVSYNKYKSEILSMINGEPLSTTLHNLQIERKEELNRLRKEHYKELEELHKKQTLNTSYNLFMTSAVFSGISVFSALSFFISGEAILGYQYYTYYKIYNNKPSNEIMEWSDYMFTPVQRNNTYTFISMNAVGGAILLGAAPLIVSAVLNYKKYLKQKNDKNLSGKKSFFDHVKLNFAIDITY